MGEILIFPCDTRTAFRFGQFHAQFGRSEFILERSFLVLEQMFQNEGFKQQLRLIASVLTNLLDSQRDNGRLKAQ